MALGISFKKACRGQYSQACLGAATVSSSGRFSDQLGVPRPRPKTDLAKVKLLPSTQPIKSHSLFQALQAGTLHSVAAYTGHAGHAGHGHLLARSLAAAGHPQLQSVLISKASLHGVMSQEQLLTLS